jgi:signal transduction histidine kinase
MLIRTRLVLLFMVIVAIVVGTLGFFIYEQTHTGVLTEIRRDIRAQARSLARSVDVVDGEVQTPELSAVATPGTHVQVVDVRGGLIAGSGELGGRSVPFLDEAFTAGRHAEVRVDGTPFLVFGAPIASDDRTVGYAVVARSPGPLYQVLHRLRGVLMGAVPVALVIAAAAVWLLVRRALRPLARLAGAASDVARRQDHTGRVAGGGRNDEVGQLASSIDSMLEALDQSHREVSESNEAQRRFLADVSHQLRAPLTIMLSSLELLQQAGDADPEFTKRTLADMYGETDRLANMVRQLLIMARTGANVAAANRPVLIGDVVADVCEHWRDNGEITFDYEGIQGLDHAVVEGNEEYLHQLLTILIDNAFKFTPSGGSVTIGGEVDGDIVEISVADTGVGIDPSEVPRIFHRFYRASNAQATDGTGLGLSIAQHIAEQHHGKIEVDSSPNVGSRFTVTLPLVD